VQQNGADGSREEGSGNHDHDLLERKEREKGDDDEADDEERWYSGHGKTSYVNRLVAVSVLHAFFPMCGLTISSSAARRKERSD